jgi:hypothetical protein
VDLIWPARRLCFGFKPKGAAESDKGPGMNNTGAMIMGVVYRAVRALPESCQNQCDRELAEFVERSGCRLADSIEFAMMQHLLNQDQPLVIGEVTRPRSFPL